MEEINSNKWCVIYNPVYSNFLKKRNKKKAILALEKLTDSYTLFITEYSKHENFLVKKAVELGYRKFISIGGDGTLNQVLNGVMKYGQDYLSEIKIGVIPQGTGNDWARHYKIRKKTAKNIAILNAGNSIKQDIGKLIFEEKESYFCSVAGLGIDGCIVSKMQGKRRFGSLEYLVASLRSFFSFTKPVVKCKWINQVEVSPKILAVVSLSSFCGGGMKIAYKADPQDGLFDVTLVKNITKFDFVWNVLKLYNGKVHEHKKVDVFKTNRVKFEIEDENQPYIQADGELIGKGGFIAELIPLAVNFIVP